MRQVALVVLLAVTCGTNSAHAQSLTLAFRVGDVYDYSVHVDFHEQVRQGTTDLPLVTDLTAHAKVTVTSVDPSGGASLSVQLFNVVRTPGSGLAEASRPAQNVKIAPDGRVTSVNGTYPGDFPFGALLVGYMISAVLPDKPVKPGDTWSKNYDETLLVANFGPFHFTTRSTYQRDESLESVNTVVIQTTSEVTADFMTDKSHRTQGTTTADVITWIDPKTRRILKSHLTAQMDATLSYLGTANASTTLLHGTETADLLPFKA